MSFYSSVASTRFPSTGGYTLGGEPPSSFAPNLSPIQPLQPLTQKTCCEKLKTCCQKLAKIAAGIFVCMVVNAGVSALIAWSWPTAAITVFTASLIINPIVILGLATAFLAVSILNKAGLDKTPCLVALLVVAAMFFGAVMGSFALLSTLLAVSIGAVAVHTAKTAAVWFICRLVHIRGDK